MKSLRTLLYGALVKLTGTRANVDFTMLFLRKEGKVLLGKRFSNFIFLFLIMFLTFLAIGIANGSLEYLRKKMKDPFISWIPVNIPVGQADSVPMFIKMLNEDDSCKKAIGYTSFSAYKFLFLEFWNEDGTDILPSIKGRTIEVKDDMMREVFEMKGNKKAGRIFDSNKELGLIVTTRLLKKLGYNPESRILFLNYAIADPFRSNAYIKFPIPIVGVVNELPGMADFFCTPNFYHQKYGQHGENPFNPLLIPHVELATGSLKEAKKLEAAVNTFFEATPRYNQVKSTVWRDSISCCYAPAYLVRVGINPPDTSLRLRDEIFQALNKDSRVKKTPFIRYYDFYSRKGYDNDTLESYDFMTIKLKSLQTQSQLEKLLLARFGLRVDMAQSQTRTNYFFVSNLTNIISLSLIVFSILSICLFITSLLQHHLEKMKMNIGTFKAFGLANQSLDRIYLSIIYLFVIAAMALAIAFSWLTGRVGGIRGLFYLAGHPLEPGELYFTLSRPWVEGYGVGWTVFSVAMILLTSYLSLKYITAKIFNRTPGDLIYDRNE